MMSKIIQAFKENAKEEHWLSPKSEKAVREKVNYIIVYKKIKNKKIQRFNQRACG